MRDHRVDVAQHVAERGVGTTFQRTVAVRHVVLELVVGIDDDETTVDEHLEELQRLAVLVEGLAPRTAVQIHVDGGIGTKPGLLAHENIEELSRAVRVEGASVGGLSRERTPVSLALARCVAARTVGDVAVDADALPDGVGTPIERKRRRRVCRRRGEDRQGRRQKKTTAQNGPLHAHALGDHSHSIVAGGFDEMS